MKKPMKTCWSLLLVAWCALVLSACGGGGGGGGAAVFRERGVYAIGPASSLDEVVGSGPAGGLNSAANNPSVGSGVNSFSYAEDANRVLRGAYPLHPGNVTISISGNDVILQSDTPQAPLIRLTPNDFTVFSNGFVSVLLGEGSITENGITYSGSEVLTLGGKSAGLEYSNFGLWEERDYVTGNNVSSSYYTNLASFILEGSNAGRLPPPAAGTFTGTVVANAQGDPNKAAYNLMGEATLALTSAFSGNLTFTFTNFYTMQANLSIDATGGMGGGVMFTFSDAHKNTTGITIPSNPYPGSVFGQFYGSKTGATATEAVGTFSMTFVRGAFGVKKR
jgi:hypothetical protein